MLALGEYFLIVVWRGGESYMPWQRKSLNQGTLLIKPLAPSRGSILMNSHSCQYPKAPPKCHHHKALRIEFLTHELSRRPFKSHIIFDNKLDVLIEKIMNIK